MKIAITGASGFLGNVLLPHLRRRFPTAHIEALIQRHDPRRAALERLLRGNISLLEGDVTVALDVDRLVAGSTYVLHLAALISYWRSHARQMHAVNVDGVRNVVEACVRHGVRRLVHVSSVGAIGFHPDGTLADEDTPFNWPAFLPYMTTKHAGQVIVEDAVRAGRLDAVVVNPASIMGPGDANPGTVQNRLYTMLRGRAPVISFSGGVAIVDVRDVCAILLTALDRGTAGERYLAVGANLPEPEVVRMICRCFGRESRPIVLPSAVCTAAGAVLELASVVTRRPPLLTAAYGRMSSWTAYFANAKSREAFGHRYLPVDRTIGDACRFYDERVRRRPTTRVGATLRGALTLRRRSASAARTASSR